MNVDRLSIPPLSTAELRALAAKVASQAVDGGYVVWAVNESGELIIGAALMLNDKVELADPTTTFVGQKVLLVSRFAPSAGELSRRHAVAVRLGADAIDVFVGDVGSPAAA